MNDMNNNDVVKIALCKEGSETFGLTKGKYYIVQDQYDDLVDGNGYMFVLNDHKASVNVRANRFGGVVGVDYTHFKTLNKPLKK